MHQPKMTGIIERRRWPNLGGMVSLVTGIIGDQEQLVEG